MVGRGTAWPATREISFRSSVSFLSLTDDPAVDQDQRGMNPELGYQEEAFTFDFTNNPVRRI